MGTSGSDRLPLTRRAVVWIVDDSPLQGEVGRAALAERHTVQLFDDGATMLERLASGPGPDLLILDWHMPNLSGLDVCRFVRESRDAGSLPVLFLTSTPTDALVEAIEAGANDFVRKPFLAPELEARVGGLVRNKRIHERLAVVEQRLRVEGEYRERFIAMLAHDLRQPLNTFSLANHTLASMVGPRASLSALLEMQSRAAQRMTRMIGELLDFTRSRPDQGMPLDREDMDLVPVVLAIVDEIRVGHPDRTVRFRAEGTCVGSWDRDRIAQICSNLIGNALEHSSTPSSPIDVAVVRRGAFVDLVVTNEGQAIPPALLPLLFEPFRRGRDGTTPTGGLGLGLHIVHEIARAHGGTVAAASDANETVFRASLPVGASPASARFV